MQHRPAPDDRGFGILEQEADRHQLHAEALERLDELAVGRARAPHDAEHGGDARAVDVGVEQADAHARSMQRHREVGGDRALADAALAAHHEDDVLHVGDGIFAGDVAADDRHLFGDLDAACSAFGERCGHFANEPLFERRRRRREDQRERDLAGGVDLARRAPG